MHWQNAIQDTLQHLVHRPRLGLVTDMDGTISPIVNDPDAAEVTSQNRELLSALQTVLDLVAVISGRAASDVHRRVGVPGLVYVGNHGLEWWTGDQVDLAAEARPYRPALETALKAVQAEQLPGMLIEDKGATLSIHYRQTRDPAAAEADFTPVAERIAHQQGLHLFKGRMVFELRPPVEINKGSAFRQLVDRYHLDAALYLGDDTTDADALRAARQLRHEDVCYALGLGVMSADTPDVVRESADLTLSGVSDVESFFSWLLKARKASST